MLDSERFLPGVPHAYVLERLEKASGHELTSGKFWSRDSSAALAVNTFGWFIDRPERLPSLQEAQRPSWPPERVEVEYCARFPWQGGSHPWLDACVMTKSDVIGVESKRFEPFRDVKTVSFSDAYDRPVWGTNMSPYEELRDRLRSGEETFKLLDAAQLVKHAFGLVTEARRQSKRPRLFYLFAEPATVGGKPIKHAVKVRHREEIARFASLVEGAAVSFSARSYREWLSAWPVSDPELTDHRERVLRTFEP